VSRRVRVLLSSLQIESSRSLGQSSGQLGYFLEVPTTTVLLWIVLKGTKTFFISLRLACRLLFGARLLPLVASPLALSIFG
jgi:hypothetical protein